MGLRVLVDMLLSRIYGVDDAATIPLTFFTVRIWLVLSVVGRRIRPLGA